MRVRKYAVYKMKMPLVRFNLFQIEIINYANVVLTEKSNWHMSDFIISCTSLYKLDNVLYKLENVFRMWPVFNKQGRKCGTLLGRGYDTCPTINTLAHLCTT
jgi:hypothetical protein